MYILRRKDELTGLQENKDTRMLRERVSAKRTLELVPILSSIANKHLPDMILNEIAAHGVVAKDNLPVAPPKIKQHDNFHPPH
jgi:hypothetical protein